MLLGDVLVGCVVYEVVEVVVVGLLWVLFGFFDVVEELFFYVGDCDELLVGGEEDDVCVIVLIVVVVVVVFVGVEQVVEFVEVFDDFWVGVVDEGVCVVVVLFGEFVFVVYGDEYVEVEFLFVGEVFLFVVGCGVDEVCVVGFDVVGGVYLFCVFEVGVFVDYVVEWVVVFLVDYFFVCDF